MVGGGPAGSFFSIFALEMAARVGLRLSVDVYEHRDFALRGPRGCNMCGGVVSESLIEDLAAEGISLPSAVIQRGIDSYVLHTDEGEVRIETPMKEKRIAAVHRGLGPLGSEGSPYASFDAFLLEEAQRRGARIVRRRIERVAREDGFPLLDAGEGATLRYDLVVIACGVNGPAVRLRDGLGLDGAAARTTRAFIREYFVGRPVIRQTLGDSMHIFLLNIPRLQFGALIPKGSYVSLCLLGDEIDQPLLSSFLTAREVASCMPAAWQSHEQACRCSPRMNVGWKGRPYAERILLVGDAGVARLYKDGIGSAYRTAKAAASAAVLEGVSEADFRLRYWPECRGIARDNALGRAVFLVVRLFQTFRFARRALLRVIAREQRRKGRPAPMSLVLWNTFTGSAPYREIVLQALRPGLLARLAVEIARAVLGRARPTGGVRRRRAHVEGR
ncbi:MAG: NAD(P)/FAD-dependent oxidoreductase [Acidobacteriota bacterium]